MKGASDLCLLYVCETVIETLVYNVAAGSSNERALYPSTVFHRVSSAHIPGHSSYKHWLDPTRIV